MYEQDKWTARRGRRGEKPVPEQPILHLGDVAGNYIVTDTDTIGTNTGSHTTEE